MLHDPLNYPEPQLFKPERFLKTDGTLNPDVLEPEMTFGFGRRYANYIVSHTCIDSIDTHVEYARDNT